MPQTWNRVTVPRAGMYQCYAARVPASMAESATATAGAFPYLDSGWHRRLLDELCAIERPSASPGEREAAEWLAAELRQLGIDARIESEPAHGTFWWPLGIAAAAGLVAGAAALRGHRMLGAALAAAAGAAAHDDAAHCGLIFNPEIPEAVERRFPGLISGGPSTSPPVIGGPVAAIPAAI